MLEATKAGDTEVMSEFQVLIVEIAGMEEAVRDRAPAGRKLG